MSDFADREDAALSALEADPGPMPTPEPFAPAATDVGNAERFARRHGHRVRWVGAWGSWLVWDGHRWRRDDAGQVVELAKDVARSMLRDAAAMSSEDKDRRAGAMKHALATESRPRLEAMLSLARSVRGIPVAPDQLDADPWLLNCANGTLDLRSGRLRDPDPGDLLTKSTGVEYDPGAAAPLFAAFLEQVQPDRAICDYLARLFGRALVGKVVDNLLPIMQGVGSNGKSTFVELVLHVLGEYGDVAEPDLLLARRETHPTGRADLAGQRLVIASETGEDRHLDEATVKILTGGDRIKARHMGRDFFTFTPSHSVFLVTNHRPRVAGTDHAIWRRIRLVPWPVIIPDDEADGSLPDKLRDEAAGVLAWLVAGCVRWQRGGLDDPARVTAATSDYRAGEDVVGTFVAECCVTSPAMTVRSSTLHEAFTAWARANGHDEISPKMLGSKLRAAGYEPDRTNSARGWQGIGLKADEPDESPLFGDG